MANTKISALTAATTPVAGTEVLPIVQSSTTKQVSIANLTAGRSVSAADYVMSTGNLVPSTAAKGVNFTANTPAAGMTSQLLNWYEEGTWTPTWSSDATPPTVTGYAQRVGTYTRIGNRVFISCDTRATVTATGTGTPQITGIPFIPPSNILPGLTLGITNGFAVLGAYRYIQSANVIFSGSTYTIAAGNYISFTAQYNI